MFSPTDSGAKNLFSYLGKQVIEEEGDYALYESKLASLRKVKPLNEHMALKSKYGLQIYAKYPTTTMKIMLKNSAFNLGKGYWDNIAHYWNYRWKEVENKFSPASLVFILPSVFYLGIYIFFLLFLIRLIKNKQYLFCFTIILFLGCFLLPAATSFEDRFRMPVEGIIVIFAMREASRYISKKS